MNAIEILRKYEDENEHHFHDVDEEWVVKAMEEYTKQKAVEFADWILWNEGNCSETTSELYELFLTHTGGQAL